MPICGPTSDPGVGIAVSSARLPTGTVTFVMTDIEGSTRLLQGLGDQYPQLLADHYRLLREAFGSTGVEVRTEGDALFYVFVDAPSALRAALDGQRRLAEHQWPAGAAVRVRMGIHSGEGRLLDGDYVGLDTHRTARITDAAHGGQVLLSDAARALAAAALPSGAALRDLGEHRLKDLERSERLFQLVAAGVPADFPPLRSLDTRQHDVPPQVTSFVGRQRESAELVELLSSCRLVTLTGPGGTGKTRLAIEVADGCVDAFADGVHFVSLATISDADLVLPTVAAQFGLREAAPASPAGEVLIDYVKQRQILLVLDNFEQIIEAAATVGELLAAALRLSVLVTSREPLRIAGEQEYPVPPLALPNGGVGRGPDGLRGVDSVALFVQRARSVRPGFDLTVGNANAVAEICSRLDGLPLALELAAARVRLFEPQELLPRLDRRLTFFAGGRDLPERQRTLRGAIDWSHELLTAAEQALFRRLSVFSGGCTLEAIEAVCRPDELGMDAINGIASLHEKSLVRRDEAAGDLRVGMLETISEYARERLKVSGEAAEITAAHSAYFLNLANSAAEHLRGPGQHSWLPTLDRELDNFRGVIRRGIESGQVETALRVTTALTEYWISRSYNKEGRQYLDQLLALATQDVSPASQAAALEAIVEIAVWQGDYATVRPLIEQALARNRESGDVTGIAAQLQILGYSLSVIDPQAARGLFAESIEAFRASGSPPMLGGSYVGKGVAELHLRLLDDAVETFKEAERAFREAGEDDFRLIPICMLGMAARLQGDHARAWRRYVETIKSAHRTSFLLGVSLALVCMADLALLEGKPEPAAMLAAASQRLSDELGGTPPTESLGIVHPLERARAELTLERYDGAVARGRETPIDEIVQIALAVAVDALDGVGEIFEY
jgi:predicted ATPase/class 3 adenylate cyclase